MSASVLVRGTLNKQERNEMTYENTLEKAHEGLTTALEVIKDLQERNEKLTNERDRYKSLRDIDAYRMVNATCSIEALEEENRDLERENGDLARELKELNGN